MDRLWHVHHYGDQGCGRHTTSSVLLWPQVTQLLLLKPVVLPALMVGVTVVCGLRDESGLALVLLASCPLAQMAFLLCHQYNAGRVLGHAYAGRHVACSVCALKLAAAYQACSARTTLGLFSRSESVSHCRCYPAGSKNQFSRPQCCSSHWCSTLLACHHPPLSPHWFSWALLWQQLCTIC